MAQQQGGDDGDRRLTRQQIQGSRGAGRRTPEMSRRLFFRRLGALGGVVAAGAAGYGIYEAAAGTAPGASTAITKPPSGRTRTRVISDAPHPMAIDGVTLPVSPVVVAENRKPGHAWWVTTPQNPGDIEGYASQTS
ncbi:MAG TPA: hypothetical protein VHW47_00260, partial [Acidimicrobiales bacterium]|nr:hypothetical protein [Acidimicrobiales bacterium]